MPIHDPQLRQVFKDKYLGGYYSDVHSRVVDELGLFWGRSRIDVAVINGHLWGYEIKSEADNLLRFCGQLDDYNLVFDYLTLVTHENHLNELDQYSDRMKSWGIIVSSGSSDNIKLQKHKMPRINKQVNSYSLTYLLWKTEAQSLLNQFSISFSNRMTKEELYSQLVANIPQKILRASIREILKNRSTWKAGPPLE